MPNPARRIRAFVINLLENTLSALRGMATQSTQEGSTAGGATTAEPVSLFPPPLSTSFTESERTQQLRVAVGLLLQTLDEINNPELLIKARELRDALQQAEPDLKHIIELRRYFAALPNKPRLAAAIFFKTPIVQVIISEATRREYDEW